MTVGNWHQVNFHKKKFYQGYQESDDKHGLTSNGTLWEMEFSGKMIFKTNYGLSGGITCIKRSNYNIFLSNKRTVY